MNFDDSFTRLIGHEGGYSNNPADPGGETMWGVTKRIAFVNGYSGAMRDYTQAQAKAVYRKMYWDAVKADSLPDGIRFDVFDAAVNSGPSQSVKWLQKAVGVADDGVIGPKTLEACFAMTSDKIVSRFNGHRLEFMTRLPAWETFSRGWARRIASNLKDA